VHDHIGDRLRYAFTDTGEQNVKNIARPVRVYALRPDAIAELPLTGAPLVATRRPPINPVAITAAAVAAVLLVAGSAWWLRPLTKSSPTPAVAATTSIAQPLAAPRLSIVVLPFANLSNDPDQQYFADGMTEDLTTDLSRIPGMFVISRNSAFTYRNKPADTRQIGRELGVRHALEGSIQRVGNQVRVNAQLIDAETGAHLWAERFDRDTGSDEESIRLIEQAICLSPRDSFAAFRYFWIGFVHLLQSRTDEAIARLEKARRADPRITPPHYFLAGAYGLKGELDRAKAELAEAQKLTGSDRYSTIARIRANADLYTPAVRDRFESALAGLRKAGMPEE
jgi:TolB-like protein